MNIRNPLVLIFIFTVFSLNSFAVFAETQKSCQLVGSYGYRFEGTSYTLDGPVPLAETGFITIDNRGNLSGEGTLAFYFSDFEGNGPLWLLLNETQSSGIVTQNRDNACAGTVDFLATAIVIKTSDPNLVPQGTVLFADLPRSLAYTISGSKKEVLNVVSTSPGTIASGTGYRQKNIK